MPSLKETKDRIVSVNSTRKITSAMKMVASSKLHHAQTLISNMLPYEKSLEHILKSFLAAMPDVRTPLNVPHADVKRVALVVFTSNSSLCGGFNNNVIKLMEQTVAEYKALGASDILVYPVGRKVAEKVTKLGLPVAGNFTELADKPNPQGCQNISEELCRKFVAGEIDKVELIYHHFKSAGSQILQRRVFLPIDVADDFMSDDERDLTSTLTSEKAQEYVRKHREQNGGKKEEAVKPLNDNFIVEPDLATVLGKLIPQELNLMVYTALLDSNASEHAARMVAMQTATDNADELLRELNLQYNKGRQQAITNELLDIVGGSVNN